jgi:ribonucleoside-diphosphate reductase alpha chain
MALNLSAFVADPFTPQARFDFEKFHEVVVKAQRLMDDLVDLEIEAVDRIRQKIASDPQPAHVKRVETELWDKVRDKAIKARRTGLGVTALGDTLAMLGLRYGSDESITKTEEIYRAMAIGAHKSSILMAEERGAFPVFSYEKEKSHDFLQEIIQQIGPEFEEKWKKFGRRNIALTTTAPTGSVSCLTQTTSGIEPAYLLSYKRRRKLVSNSDAGVIPDFVDASGDKWQEYTVYHHSFKKWMDVSGKTSVEDSPYHNATSNDIDWLKSVEIQAAAQRWIDHSISKTCNLPNNATRELVSQVYMTAWKSGCKGFTVYRDGCRTGVLVQETKKEEKSSDRAAEKRPKELPCEIHRVNIRGENWLVLVGLKGESPYEIFCGVAENIEVPKKSKTGLIIKNGKKDGVATYNLKVPVGNDDEVVFKDIVNLFANPAHSAFTRTLSLTLRHQIPINFTVEQLQKEKNDDMFSFSRVLARVLKTYIPDGTKSTGDKVCKNCGSDSLVYMEGCVTCSSCGSSKCS